MKRVLIAGTGPDPHHIYSGCVLALEALGLEAVQSMEAEDLAGCSGLILPGGVPDVDPRPVRGAPGGQPGGHPGAG